MSNTAFVCEASPTAISRRIHSFRDLAPGWHFGEGRPATNDAVSVALVVVELLPDRNDVEAFPGVDGGILVAAYHGSNETLEVRCEPDGRVDFWHEVNDEIVEESEDVRLGKIVDYLGDLAWEPNKSNSSASCTLSITAPAGVGLRVSPSDRQPQTVESRFSMPSAPSQSAGESVRTSIGITRDWLVIPPSSGDSTPRTCFQMTGGGSHASLQQPATRATGTFVALENPKVEKTLRTTLSTTYWKSAGTEQARAG